MADETRKIENAGADMAHLDVMDGVFVPNFSFGLPVISSLRKHTDIFFDVHLMIVNPEKYIERFIDAGADLITFHLEATDDPKKCIGLIRGRGKSVGISIKPATPIEAVYPYLELCDMVLVMTVEPGFGGQSLIPYCLDKVKKLRDEINRRKLNADIQVDGGINEETSKSVIAAGANILVAGSSVFRGNDKKAVIDALRG
jgi:ribulose-phosphate 3-epimerase